MPTLLVLLISYRFELLSKRFTNQRADSPLAEVVVYAQLLHCLDNLILFIRVHREARRNVTANRIKSSLAKVFLPVK